VKWLCVLSALVLSTCLLGAAQSRVNPPTISPKAAATAALDLAQSTLRDTAYVGPNIHTLLLRNLNALELSARVLADDNGTDPSATSANNNAFFGALRGSIGGDQFVVNFTVRYWGNQYLLDGTDGDFPLFTRTQRAVYARQSGSADYALVAQGSNITPCEIETVFHPDNLTCRDFLTFNTVDIAAIASGSDTPAKAVAVALRRGL
jgi:hypothetical protein